MAIYSIPHHCVDADRHFSFADDEPTLCHPSRGVFFRPVLAAADALFEANGVGVHLTGHGGDSVFCGDSVPPLHLSELVHFRSISHTASTDFFVRVGREWHPLLYRPLVEFMLSVPWKFLIDPKIDRVIHREVTKGLLPESIRRRTSKGNGTPLFLRSVRVNWPRIEPVLLRSRLAEMGLVEQAAFATAGRRLRHGVMSKQFRYMAGALSLELWLRSREFRPPALDDRAGALQRLRAAIHREPHDAHAACSLRTANV